MTVAVAYSDPLTGRAALALDTVSSFRGNSLTNDLKRPHVWQLHSSGGHDAGQLVLAGAGSARLTTLVDQYKPPPRDDDDWLSYLIADVTEGLRAHTYDYPETRDDERHNYLGGYWLGLLDHHVFMIGGDFSVSMPSSGWWAIGSGAELALGALHVLHELNGSHVTAYNVESIVRHAHAAAGALDQGVGELCTVVTFGG